MNTPSPLIPAGSLQRMPKGSSNVRIAVLITVTLHAVLFCGILVQGCKRDRDGTLESGQTNAAANNALPQTTTNYASYYQSYSELTQQVQNPEPPVTTPNTQQQSFTPSSDITQHQDTPTPPQLPENRAANPVPPPVQPIQSAPTQEYTVVRGDSFYKIAGDHHVTLPALKAANPSVDAAHILPGQKIKIPPPDTSNASSSSGGDAVGAGYYKVQSGDTLTKIAADHKTTIDKIKSLNQLRTTRIYAGQRLRMPAASDTH